MRFTLVLLTVFFVFSCGSSEPKTTTGDSVIQPQAAKPELKKGDCTDLTVTGDPSNSFTVYLPSDFDSTKKYPVVIFFDPHADGRLPLNKYKSVAEKWGFIFVGSNSSKNGMTQEQSKNIVDGLVNEAKAILPIDPQQILVCGFSGGARVATSAAIYRTDIKGVIGNSAAGTHYNNPIIFVGIAGLGDMNYLEMKTFENNSAGSNFKHELLVFDGKHEWAPVTMMENALLICSTYNPATRAYDLDAYKSDALEQSIISQADSLKKISCLLANNLLQTGVRTKGVPSPTDTFLLKQRKITAIASAFEKTPCVKSDGAAWKAAEEEEFVLQQELAGAMLSQDTAWWKTNADKYFESKKQGADKFMHQRLRGYASLMCYSYANQAFKANNLHAAEKLVAVYAIVDPTNSEWAYMRAILYMQLSLPDYALSSLEKAMQLGFKDKNRLQNDPAFLPIRSDARFSALTANMN
jgi:hypothetical protein